MRIAVWHNLPSGGAKRALYDHVRGLVARGHTLESWCPPTADQTYLPLSDLIPEHVVPAQPLTDDWRRTAGSLFGLRTYNMRRIAEVDEYARRCADEINSRNFDLLFANTSLEIAVSSIGRYVRLPSVLYLQEPSRWLYEAQPTLIWAGDGRAAEHSAWTPAALNASLRTAIRMRGFRFQAQTEWRNLREFKTILVNSRFSRETVLRTYGLDATVCYLGVDSEKFVQQYLPREDYVVGVGTIAPRKNVRLVIEALAQLQCPRPRLLWIGDMAKPEYLAELNQLAESSEVDFKPLVRLDDDKLIEVLNRASMMVYTPRLEPFGFAPLEANACGLPVVAVAEGGVRETIQDGVNGLLVEHEPQAVADAIDYLRKNPNEAERMGQQGAALVAERWSVAAAVDRLEQNLQKVLHETQ
ncbi:MAG TPA: glycosyltransferase family 4 protein [Pyrinomonadaceae bacterium]|nr:glycosyltransferase family 4 protein [Pyrinomonadaceae bacterium]